MESWSDDVSVTVTNPSFFAPIEGETEATMSLGFTSQDGGEDDEDFPKADFASFSATLTCEQAKALGETLIERAEQDAVGIAEEVEE